MEAHYSIQRGENFSCYIQKAVLNNTYTSVPCY